MMMELSTLSSEYILERRDISECPWRTPQRCLCIGASGRVGDKGRLAARAMYTFITTLYY